MLYSVVNGSNLYGLATSHSDVDVYNVYAGKGKSSQRFCGDFDITTHSFDSWIKNCNKGIPQALEAMFAPTSFVLESAVEDFRHSFYAHGAEVIDTYSRTIYKLAMGNQRKRGHAIRLAFQLSDIMESGRFNPRLTADKKSVWHALLAEDTVDKYRKELERIAGIQLFYPQEGSHD